MGTNFMWEPLVPHNERELREHSRPPYCGSASVMKIGTPDAHAVLLLWKWQLRKKRRRDRAVYGKDFGGRNLTVTRPSQTERGGRGGGYGGSGDRDRGGDRGGYEREPRW